MKIKVVWNGELLDKRVIIWNPKAISLYDDSGYGKPVPENNPNRLELDLIEAAFLMERKRLRVFVMENNKKRYLTLEELMRIGEERVNQFHLQYVVYRDLRNRGLLVKTGYKFGAHFRVYGRGVKLKRGPKAPHEHTRWVVHCVNEEAAFSLPEMSRAVRLAHNIRATFLWAVVDKENDVTYYQITRISP